MPDTAIHFHDVNFGFVKGKPLFEGLFCSLANTSHTGKIVALMGPSGVGKTTFCDLALGLRQPQKGSVNFVPQDANIALIPQKAVLFDELSVEENIACLRHSKTLGQKFQENRIQHAVTSLGLADVLRNGTPTSALSGGEAQRVMLARIQTIKCDVLILDEPCSFLDNRLKAVFLAALRQTVDESGILALMVTHVWDEALLVADEVLFFHQSPGESVRLYSSTPAAAPSHPSTLDALYSIHWPHCLVMDCTEPVAGILNADIPDGARFVGLHSDSRSDQNCDEWASEVWNKVAKRSSVKATYLPVTKSITINYYDQNGILLEMKS